MPKKYDLLDLVLKRFQDAGILENLILIGSWCLYFYQEYFSPKLFRPLIRTRDIDFLVPHHPPKNKKEEKFLDMPLGWRKKILKIIETNNIEGLKNILV